MSRNSALLSRAAINTLPPSTDHSPLEDRTRPGAYFSLIQRLFTIPSVASVVAIGSSGSSDALRRICDEIATELAASGKRVLIVPAATVVAAKPGEVPEDTAFVLGRAPNTWIWAPSRGRWMEFPKVHLLARTAHWPDALRLKFDAILLECPALGDKAGVVEVMALADAAVLVAEAGRTSKHRVQRDQRALELKGAKLAGCILIKKR